MQAVAASILVLLLISGVMVYAGPLIISSASHGSNNGHNSNRGHDTHSNTHTQTETETETETSSTDSSNNLGNLTKQSHELVYRMVGTGGYSGQGQANIQIKGTDLGVNLEIEHANPGTTYSVILVAIPTPPSGGSTVSSGTSGMSTTTTTGNACTNPIGMLVTSKVGQGIAHLDTSLSVGTYQIGVLLCIGSNPALVSQPTTQLGIITAGKGHDDMSSAADSVNPVSENHEIDSEIQALEQGDGVAGVVTSTGSIPTLTQLDQNFAMSAGKFQSSGLVVSIGTTSVERPEIVIVNLGVSMWQHMKGLNITMDGAQVQYSSSVSQVLSLSNQSAYYSLIQTSHGIQLLISIPHFSNHVIEIVPVYSYNWSVIGSAGILVIGAIGVAAFLMEKKKIISLPKLV